MTHKIVTFGSLKVWSKFKMSHQGKVWVKTSSSTNPSIDSHNARQVSDPTIKTFLQSTTGVIAQS